MERVYIHGVAIDSITTEQAVKRALHAPNSVVVYTPNATMLECCRKDASLTRLLNRATLSLPDGKGVLWKARLMKKPLPERVAGIEFGELLMKQAAKEGLRVYLLGGKDGVAFRAAKRLTALYPDLCICGCHAGYFSKYGQENECVLSKIRSARPDILFVCFGFPIQEEWIEANRKNLSSIRVIAALGGSIDVWAADVRRAPRWIASMGMEWAWRMVLEPHRFRQLPGLVRFILQK